MALIKCPECGKEVSDKAPACIHCGYPLSNYKSDQDQVVDQGGTDYDLNQNSSAAPPKLKSLSDCDEAQKKIRENSKQKKFPLIIIVILIPAILVLNIIVFGSVVPDFDALYEKISYNVEQEATCTETGIATKGIFTKETIELPALGHNFNDGVCSRCGNYDDYLAVSLSAFKRYFNDYLTLKNPSSLQIHQITYYPHTTDTSKFALYIDFSAMNSMGGYTRDEAYILLTILGDEKYSANFNSTYTDFLRGEYSLNDAYTYKNVTKFLNVVDK